MAVYLVTYDLRSETQRPPIVKELKEAYPAWCYLSESSYAVSTNQTVDQVYEFFRKFTDDNDYLLIIPLKQKYRGWVTQDVHDWLNRNLPQ